MSGEWPVALGVGYGRAALLDLKVVLRLSAGLRPAALMVARVVDLGVGQVGAWGPRNFFAASERSQDFSPVVRSGIARIMEPGLSSPRGKG